jgi:hypothetical protein
MLYSRLFWSCQVGCSCQCAGRNGADVGIDAVVGPRRSDPRTASRCTVRAITIGDRRAVCRAAAAQERRTAMARPSAESSATGRMSRWRWRCVLSIGQGSADEPEPRLGCAASSCACSKAAAPLEAAQARLQGRCATRGRAGEAPRPPAPQASGCTGLDQPLVWSWSAQDLGQPLVSHRSAVTRAGPVGVWDGAGMQKPIRPPPSVASTGAGGGLYWCRRWPLLVPAPQPKAPHGRAGRVGTGSRFANARNGSACSRSRCA